MTKKEQQQINTQNVISLLKNKFNATAIEDGDGGRMNFMIGEFDGEFHRRDFGVIFWDSIAIGSGFTQEEYDIREAACVLEDEINKSIKEILSKNTQ